MEFSMKRIGSMTFHARTPSGHDVIVDTKREFGGNECAATPMELVLVALMGCTSMDVVSILEKMKVEGYNMEVVVESEKAEQHPKAYTSIELTYRFRGEDLPKEKIMKAVNLSQDKYCSVSAMLGKAVSMSYKVVVGDEEI
ncbi:MAG TPA: osmotically inducible protein C [Kosmotogaceae bacterium]|nr:MAG: OsmC family protein [Thermotogales bacterium 46_20]HAA85909.1 osmotically inducible protein C [Kosmotogaceae bacterium]